MAITITSQIVVAYSQCPRKAYLLMYSEEHGQLHEYQQILEQNRLAYQSRHLDILKQKPNVYPYNLENLKKGCDILIDPRLTADGLQADCDILTKVGKQTYEPTILIGTRAIDDTDKLHLIFIGHVLTKVQGNPPAIGHIIAADGKSSKVRLQQSRKTLSALLEPLQKWSAADSPPAEPPIMLNKHCPLCQFRVQCEANAIQEDSLSRLAGVTPRVIRRYERKGIFTVKQLSYLFKPRKRKKRSKNPPPTVHNIELQALAIRTGRIYLQELPTLIRQETELFLDIESVPDQGLHYLFGLLVCQGEIVTYHPFWADKADDEESMWQAFLALVNQYSIAPIYHYGSYEPRTIAKLARQHATGSENLTKRLINAHKQIYGKIYFPVYSNRLKDVARFVGATWTHPDASGLQSIVWRYKWNETHENWYKDILLTYNEEDCRALKLLVEEISKIQLSAKTLPEVDFADQYKQQTTEAGEKVVSQFKEILEFAHFDYDKKKIYFRQAEDENQETQQSKSEMQRLAARKFHEKRVKIQGKAKKIVQIPHEEICPECGYEPLTPTKVLSQRFIVDLVLTKNGIRKTITEYSGAKAFCSRCKKSYAPLEIRKYTGIQVYGRGFGTWIVYQRVALRLPYEGIVESVFEQFGEAISISKPQEFLDQFAKYYAGTERQISDSLLRSPFIHVDETKVNM